MPYRLHNKALGVLLISDIHGWFLPKRNSRGGWINVLNRIDELTAEFKKEFKEYNNQKLLLVSSGDLFSPVSPFCSSDLLLSFIEFFVRAK